MYEEFIKVCSQVGFPIAVCIYLLFERGKSTKSLTKAINELTILIKTRLK